MKDKNDKIVKLEQVITQYKEQVLDKKKEILAY